MYDLEPNILTGRIFNRIESFNDLPTVTVRCIQTISDHLRFCMERMGTLTIINKKTTYTTSGMDLIQWLIDEKLTKTRLNGAYICQLLLNSGRLQGTDTNSSLEFLDSPLLYCIPSSDSIMDHKYETLQAGVLAESLSLGSIKKWNGVYVLLLKSYQLYIYENDISTNPILKIDLRNIRIISFPLSSDIQYNNGFRIESLNQNIEYDFITRNERDFNEWKKIFNKMGLYFREPIKQYDNINNIETIYDLYDRDYNGNPIHFDIYRNYLLLIVNVPYRCTYSEDYEPLKELNLLKKSNENSLKILLFPTSEFIKTDYYGDSLFGENKVKKKLVYENIYTFLHKYQMIDNFDLFEKSQINGPKTRDIYKYIKIYSSNHVTFMSNNLNANYIKYLIDSNGQPVKKYESTLVPSQIHEDVAFYSKRTI